MSLKQTFTYAGNVDPEIPFHVWARRSLRLISPEYKRWEAAVKRQEQLRQQAIDAGYLVHDVENSVYIWNDEWAKDKEYYELKEYDEEWLEFWNQYLRETGTEFKTDLIKE
jgi:hypothetical protein